ncbi:hypothetical protein FHS43_000863 [Streptosporangium becharense]|uniref:GmrSD restriction endonucleases N-terminal domain-containing protein n=1 Tax=Streptosporangium becharense TaxID=1816182 RepID=A0A7W9IEX1_9ACTN|nr:DUF262 domain-containing protein [Streptosporangium becharense]MBB2909617.1 hypothetical protein [Streptosporangium becharense]MBB5819427.1 hypothetical protein [Streptosporangium becharense]
MSSGLDTRPSATTYDVEKLVGMAWRGQIRVPHFQRDFRWGREDVIRLFDSIVKGYPVGSLLLWVRPAAEQILTLGALRIEAPRMDPSLWVVDGQQRITSLANALHEEGGRDPRFALAYDLRNERFIPRPTAEDPHVVPLPILFDLRKVLRWFTAYPGIPSSFQDRAFNLTTVLRQYPMPAYQVEQESAEVLQDIFDRMNNYGKRLSKAEIFSALYAGEESAQDRTLTIDLIATHVDEQFGFGRIDNDTVLRAMLARRGPDPEREIRTEFDDENRREVIEFPGEDRDTAYQAGEEALARAVRFLQNEVGVPHFSLLAYRYLLIVLTRVFAHFPDPDPANRRLLRRWYWRAALLGPEIFKGSSTGASRALCAKIQPSSLSESVQSLLNTLNRPAPPLPELRRFRTNEAATKITLCSWWALTPRDPSTGALSDRIQLAECLTDRPTAADAVRYILPSRLVPEKYRLWAANRVLLPSMGQEAGKNVGDVLANPPITMDEGTWLKVLDSHLITPEMATLLQNDQVVPFLQGRQSNLISIVKSFLDRMCEWRFENTPPISDLLIEDLPGDEPALPDEEFHASD